MPALARSALSLLLALACALTAPPAGHAEDPPVTEQAPAEPAPAMPAGGLPADARLITDPAELADLLADHTIHGAYWPDGETWREFTARDGRTILDAHGCLRPGTWRISGSVVCYIYPSLDNGRPQCFLVYRSAAVTHFVVANLFSGGRQVNSNGYEILDGNVDGLPLDFAHESCSDLNV